MKSFKPDQLVLVRFAPDKAWRLRRYSSPCNAGTAHETQDGCVHSDDSILPYEGNESLLGVVGNILPAWEPKRGEQVAVRNQEGHPWIVRNFVRRQGEYFICEDYFRFCEPACEHFTMPKE